MNKEYKLKTIEEILSVINSENVENFKKDFCNWLDFRISLEKVNKSDLLFVIKKENTIFWWIDDNKTDVNIKIIIKDNFENNNNYEQRK